MIKAFFSLWKNTFNYSGTAERKEYWLGVTANVIFMYILIVPVALITRTIPFLTAELLAGIHLFICHLPVFALYVRRARTVGWKISTTLLVTVCLPIFSGIMMGVLPSHTGDAKPKNQYSLFLKLMCVGMGMFIYSSFISIFAFGTPEALSPVTITGLLLAAGSLVIGYLTAERK